MQHDSKLIRDLVNMMDPTSPLAIEPKRYEGHKNILWWSNSVSGYSEGGGGGDGGGGGGGGGGEGGKEGRGGGKLSASRKRATLKRSRSRPKKTGGKVAGKTVPT